MATDDDGSSVKLGTPDTSTGTVTDGSDDNASQSFADLLDADTRGWAETKGLKTVADLAKSARNAEALIGKSVRVPEEGAPAEEWTAFLSKAGLPEKADGYVFTPIAGMPDGAGYEEEAKQFRDIAHKAGLTKRQAAAMHDAIFGAAAANVQEALAAATAAETAATAEATAKRQAATDTLVKAWGGPQGSVEFKKANHLANRAIGDLGGADLVAAFKEAGMMSEEGHVLNPAIALAMHKVGQKLYSEDALRGGDAVADASNPFREGPDKGNLTDQNLAIKADPLRAVRMMREAGHKPEAWFGAGKVPGSTA